MVKESARKCSHCGNNGHNSRTCNQTGHGVINNINNNKGVCLKLFGVNIMERQEDSMKKSFSMGNLQAAGNVDQNNNINAGADDAGYLSDGLIHNKKPKAAHERKKGYLENDAYDTYFMGDHGVRKSRVFLAGLKKLGKGDWRGISRKFVTTRTPTQVASHAQKYFLRQAISDKRKRRTSLFDIHFNELSEQCASRDSSLSPEAKNAEASSASCTTSSPGSTSKALPQITTTMKIPQETMPSQVLSRFPHLCLVSPEAVAAHMPAASCSVPIYAPVMVGMPAAAPYAPAVHYGSPTIHYMLNTQGSNIATCQPVISHPSGIPSLPRSLPSSPSMGVHRTHSPITKKDALELKIAQPQPSQGANASSPSSGGNQSHRHKRNDMLLNATSLPF